MELTVHDQSRVLTIRTHDEAADRRKITVCDEFWAIGIVVRDGCHPCGYYWPYFVDVTDALP